MCHLSHRAHIVVSLAIVAAYFAIAAVIPILGVPKHDRVNGHDAASNYVIAKFRTPPSVDQIAQLMSEIDGDADRPIGGLHARVLHSRSKHAAELVVQLAQRADIEYVEPDYVVFPA